MVLSVLSFLVILTVLALTVGFQTYKDIAGRRSLAATLEAVERMSGDNIGRLGLELQESCHKAANQESSEKIRLSKEKEDRLAKAIGFKTSRIDYQSESDRLYRMAFSNCIEHDRRYTAYLFKGYGSAADYRGMINESIWKAIFLSVFAVLFVVVISIGIGHLIVGWIPSAIAKVLRGLKAAYHWITAPEK